MARVLHLLFLVVVLFVAGCVLCSNTTKATVSKVEARLDRELPIGSTRSEVEEWLDSQRFERSRYGPLGHSSVLNEEGTDLSICKGEIVSLIRGTDRSLFVEGSIQIHFLFGADDRLAKRIVRWIGTGP